MVILNMTYLSKILGALITTRGTLQVVRKNYEIGTLQTM